jgi:chromosome segregation ATPase
MDPNVERKISYLRAKGDHAAANALAIDEESALRVAKEIARDVTSLRDDLRQLDTAVRTLATAIATLSTRAANDIKSVRETVLASVPPLKKAMQDFVVQEIHTAALGIEREFGSAISLTAGSGARKAENEARLESTMQSFERRLSRNAEHVAKLEDRMKSLERE